MSVKSMFYAAFVAMNFMVEISDKGKGIWRC